MTRLLVYLGHPAHFHLLKEVITAWQQAGKEVLILLSRKDVLEDLLREEGLPFVNILPKGRGKGWKGMLMGFMIRSWKIFLISRRFKPDLLTGTSAELPLIGRLCNIPVINLNEDDHDVVPLYSRISYPFSTYILMPDGVRAGRWHRKVLRYPGYHELAYLHPDQFKVDEKLVHEVLGHEEPYSIIRLSALKAHHDKGIKGIEPKLALHLTRILQTKGRVYISAEGGLPDVLEEFRLKANPRQIHHIMALATLFIGDSQTMAAEAAMLGVPFIRYNSFVGRISYLEQLEMGWELGYGFSPGNEKEMLACVKMLLDTPKLRKHFVIRRDRMLSHKINTSSFLKWFYLDFPESVQIMQKNPKWWDKFFTT